MNSHVAVYCRWRKFNYLTHGYRQFCTYNMYEERHQWHDFEGQLNWAFLMWDNGFLEGWR